MLTTIHEITGIYEFNGDDATMTDRLVAVPACGHRAPAARSGRDVSRNHRTQSWFAQARTRLPWVSSSADESRRAGPRHPPLRFGVDPALVRPTGVSTGRCSAAREHGVDARHRVAIRAAARERLRVSRRGRGGRRGGRTRAASSHARAPARVGQPVLQAGPAPTQVAFSRSSGSGSPVSGRGSATGTLTSLASKTGEQDRVRDAAARGSFVRAVAASVSQPGGGWLRTSRRIFISLWARLASSLIEAASLAARLRWRRSSRLRCSWRSRASGRGRRLRRAAGAWEAWRS